MESVPTSLYVINKLGTEIQDWLVEVILYLPKILWGAAIFAITYFIAKYTTRFLKKLLEKTKLEKTIIHIITLVINWIIILIGSLMTLNALGLNGIVTSIIAGAGFTSVVIAFGTQDISKNLIAGAFILATRQFKIGDNIIVHGGHEGIVRRISVRSITLESTDGRLITVPSNTIFSNVVTNLTAMGRRKATLAFKLENGSDFTSLSEDINELILKQPTVFKKPKPEILITEVTGKSYTITVSYWTDSSPMMQRKSVSEVNEKLLKFFVEKKLLAQ